MVRIALYLAYRSAIACRVIFGNAIAKRTDGIACRMILGNAISSSCYDISIYRKKAMTTLVQELLNTFDRLTDSERLDLVLEILKRTVDLDFSPLSDEDLVMNAEGLFLDLDEEEGSYE
jgi:hypothetical protein